MKENNSLLDMKYKNIKETILKMMSFPNKEMRPTCEELLIKKHFWYLGISDIESDVMFQQFKDLSLNELSIEHNFCKYFIKTKF